MRAVEADDRASRSRRPRRNRSGRGLAQLLPHFITTGNLAAGFYSIIKSSQGEFERAALALIFAGLFDFLDGRVARMAQSTSRFGVEYDSIADTVSFGVAPAVLAFHAGAFQELGWTGWVTAFMYAACAALRLARFNVSPGRYSGRFEGLPSPAAAGTVVATVLFKTFLDESGFSVNLPAFLGALGLAFLGLLMVSSIPYRSQKGLEFRGSYRTVVSMVVGFVVILSQYQVALFIVGIVYTASGPVSWYWRRRTGRVLEEIPLPESATEEDQEEVTP